MIALALTAGWLMVIGMLSVCRLLNVGAGAMPADVGVDELLTAPFMEPVT